MIRLYSIIEEYKLKIQTNDNAQNTKDIPFGTLYQELLRKNNNENLISILLNVDGVGLTKSSKLKMWTLSGCFVELYPKLRNQRCNTVSISISIWIGHTEPPASLWLRNSTNKLQDIKSKGITFTIFNRLIENY